MALELIGGAVVGTLVSELVSAIKNVKKTVVEFRDILELLELTLKSVDPMVKELDERKQELDRPKEELEGLKQTLKEGKLLVEKCSMVVWYDIRKKRKYRKELQGLYDYIFRFFGINITGQIARDCMEILARVNSIDGSTRTFVSSGAPDPPALTVGLDRPLKELKKRFFRDGAQVLVLSAYGGCGKTTLAKMFCHDEQVKGKFKNNIFFFYVSKTTNLMGIIRKLFEHKGFKVPDFQNDEEAVGCLGLFLKKIGTDPILLVLDDVWSGSEDLIKKFVFHIPDYKILVTSRFTFPRFNNTYRLELLNYEESMTLFCRSAFSQNESPFVPENLVNKIVRRYKGCPLALTVVGSSLCGKPAVVWQNLVTGWSEGQSIYDFEVDVLKCLQTSFDALDGIMKECFLDISSFLEDQRIPAAALIDIWVELYKLDEDKSVENLLELSTRNLVNLVATRKDASEVDGSYNEHYVMQHDLLRDLAIHQSRGDPVERKKRLVIDTSGNNLPKWFMELKQQSFSVRLLSIFTGLAPKWFMGLKQQLFSARLLSILACLAPSVELKQQPFSARVLSVYTDDTFSSSLGNTTRLSEVEVLVLHFRTKKYTLPEFMKKMSKLKVLLVMNDGVSPANLSNFPRSLPNLKRIRLEHICIPPLSKTTAQLNNLYKISLIMCKVDQAFSNCTIQLSDMLPSLAEIVIDYCIDLKELPAGLCDIVNLKKLSITNCHKLSKLPERIGNLENLEFLRLRACTGLSELPTSIGGLRKLRFLDISDCCSLKRMPEEMRDLCDLNTLHMRGCSRLSELPPSIEKLKNLRNVFCDEETSSLWERNTMVPEQNEDLDWLIS